ncbi:MAG: hypothetical protein HY904_19305 [Deltaproteobacteria bacterium]|nr:hypothetical protein [Deltaproteobacteria bacterium]
MNSLPQGSPERVTVFCPECGRRYAVLPAQLADPSLRLLCGNCESLFTPRLPEGDAAAAPAAAASRPPAAGPTVVVAHESPAVCATVGRVLEEAGFVPRYVHDGARAVAAFDASLPDHPVALVLDVGIPVVMAFQVVQVLRGRPGGAALRIILLASVFERTRYKRRPTSLHGADAHIELHHVPDRLGVQLRDLLESRQTPPPRTHMPVERALAEALRAPQEPVNGLEAARALARRLVSDVALYHEASLARGLKSGGPLEGEVAAAVAEARGIFQSRAVALGESARGVFDEAVAELLSGLSRGVDPGARTV